MMCHSIGRPPISTIGFGRTVVSSESLVPSPPARITVFMTADHPTMTAVPPVNDLPSMIASHPIWYHTIELAPGVETPGWFDLRPIVDQLPWPDVRGKRCLDVGTYDGFLAFEMERRGASVVVATDIAEPRGLGLAAPREG